MRLYSIIILTMAGLAILAGAEPRDKSLGNTDLSDGSPGTDADDSTDVGNTQSTGGTGEDTDDGSGVDDGSGTDDGSGSAGDNSGGDEQNSGGGGDDNIPSGMMSFFGGKGSFGGWPGFASGGRSNGPPSQLRARSFRFGNEKYTGFHRRGFGGFAGSGIHQHSARDDIQKSGPSLNSVWYGGDKINPAS